MDHCLQRDRRQIAFRLANIGYYVAPFYPPEFLQALFDAHDRRFLVRVALRGNHQHAHSSHLVGLLHTQRERFQWHPSPRSQGQGAGYQIGGYQPANIVSGFSRPQYDDADATDTISSSVAGASSASPCFGCVLWFIAAVEIDRTPADDKNRADG